MSVAHEPRRGRRRPGRGSPFARDREGRTIAGTTVKYAFLVGVVVVMATPFFWMLSTALKAPNEVLVFPPVWLPSEPRWRNFIDAWNAAPFARFYANSLFVATAQTILEITIGILCAYAFARLRFPGRDALFALVLATLMIPNDVSLIPNYVTLASVGWINTYWALILPSASNAFGTFLLRQHILSLPEALFDAAKIDGATHGHILRHVVVPLSMPIVLTLFLLSFVSTWNAYLWPLIVTNSADMRTLPIGLAYFRNEEGGDPWHLIMAAATFIVAPVILLFLFTQRHFLRGITSGALRGG